MLSAKDREEISDMITKQILIHATILHPTHPPKEEERKPPTAIETNQQFGDKTWLYNTEYERLLEIERKYNEIADWEKEFFEILKKNLIENAMERLERGK
jgi:hypothetical protein